MKVILASLFVLSALLAEPCQACWQAVAAKYSDAGIDAQILYKIAKAESNLNSRAVAHNANGTRDIGLLQINSSWLPRLHARFGLRESDLYNWCTNLDVGAWILADLFRQYGPSWEAVGAFNASCQQLRDRRCRLARATYAWRVHRQRAPGDDALPARG